MGIFDKKRSANEPEPKEMIYFVLTEDDYLEQIESDCVQSNLCYFLEAYPNGERRIYFYKDDQALALEIMNRPRARPVSQKISLNTKINAAQNRTQNPNSLRGKTMTMDAETGVQSVPSRTEQPKESHPPTDGKNRWVEEKMIKELEQKQKTNTEGGDMPVAIQKPEVEPTGKQRKKRTGAERTYQIKTRLNASEKVQFKRRLKKSGLAQGDFIRRAVLTGQIVIEEYSAANVALVDELALIRAELGRQGGLLKMIIKPNEGRRELAPEEWRKLLEAIRDIEKMKTKIANLEVQDGNCKAQNK